jgi:hypothetical protein
MLNFIRNLFAKKLEVITVDIPTRETDDAIYTYAYGPDDFEVFDYIEAASLDDLVIEVTGPAE